MKSILRALYYGSIHPAEDYILRSPEYKKQSEAFMQNRDAFADKLDQELAQEYERLNDAHNVLFSIEEADAYTRGMKLGARLALELLGDDAGRR